MYLGRPVIGNFKEPREKRKRPKSPAEKRDGKDDVYLAKIRSLPCCVCGSPPPNTVHHLKTGKRRGMALRAEDKDVIPMCLFPDGKDCHGTLENQGSKNELRWLMDRGVQPLSLAKNLWARRHSLEEMQKVLEAHKS